MASRADDADTGPAGGLHTLQTAAAAAAIGAAAGAARALATRHGGERDEPQAEDHGEREAEPDEERPGRQEEPEPAASRPSGASRERVRDVVERARDQLRELHGAEPESLTTLERRDDGWLVTFEVVELRRVPDSTDVLATYALELDGDGGLVAYERVRRYYRAQADVGDDR